MPLLTPRLLPAWLPGLTASVVGHENGGRYLQTSANDTPMLVLVFEVLELACGPQHLRMVIGKAKGF